MNAYQHSKVSALKFGGVPDDYYDIHYFMDSTKAICNDNRHRILYTEWAIRELILPVFGRSVTNSLGQEVCVESICRDHVQSAYGRSEVPDLSDFVNAMQFEDSPLFRKKLDDCFSQFAGNETISRILLSPLLYTNQVKSLVLTLNTWFLDVILPQLVPALPNFAHFTGEEVFNRMRLESWMNEGAMEVPMKETTHIIRKIAYHYDGQCFSKHVDGAIVAAFNDYEKAKEAFEELEFNALRTCYLDEYAPIGSPDIYAYTREELHRYMIREFNLAVLVPAQQRQTLHKNIRIPATATKDQVAEISKISRIAFYNLSSFEAAPSFYVIDTFHPFFETEGVISRAGAPIFFNTYEDAAKHLSNHLADFKLYGRVDELTDTPAIFQQIVDDESWFVQDRARETLQVRIVPGLLIFGLLGLVDCLKVKPFRIRKISVDAVRHIEHKVYEQ